MVSDIEFLETVCERMQQVGLVQSKADFSTRMLGKGPSYLTSMSARDRRVPDEVMAFLAEELEDDVADDDAEISRLNGEAQHREHNRKHRTDMLGWVARHRAVEPVQEPPRQQRFGTSLSLRQKLSGWLLRDRVVTP